MIRMDGEVQNVQSVFVEFVDHEPDNAIIDFGDHADAIALPQTTDEVVLVPGELETTVFDSQDRRHVAADHPSNMYAHGRLLGFHVGLLSSD